MDNVALAAQLTQELEFSARSDLQQNQARALQFYDCDAGDVAPGWSALVSSDVRDAVESTTAELVGAINPNEPMGFFDPSGPDDVERSELETWAVHTALFGKNRGMLVLEQAIRDALMLRYCIVKAWVETDTKKQTKQVDNIDAQTMAALMQAGEPGVEYTVDLLETTGPTFSAKITRTETRRRFVLDSVAPENFRWSNDLRGPNLAEARFLAERTFRSRAELADDGIRDAGDLPQASDDSTVTQARNADNTSDLSLVATEQDQPIEVWICYLRNLERGGWDVHEFVSPSRVIRSSYTEFHPFAGGVTTLRPHRFDGVSLYDRIGPIQETKTFLLRQLATQARLTNQTRLVARDRTVSPEDINNDALNPVIRVTGIPAECLMPLPVQDITSQLLATMQWIDSLRREAGGASIDMTSPELQIAGQSAHAAEREYSFREMQAQSMLRTFGDTLVRSLYLLTHATLKAEMGGEQGQVLRGREWAQYDPQVWPSRTDVQIDVGQPLGVRSRRQAALMQTVGMQSATLQAGGAGLLVSLADMYRAQVDLGKMAGLRDAARYWTDPDSKEAMQKAQAQQQATQQQAQEQARQQREVVQATMAIESLKSETAILQTRMEDSNKVLIERMKVQQAYFDSIIGAIGKNLDMEQVNAAAGQSGIDGGAGDGASADSAAMGDGMA